MILILKNRKEKLRIEKVTVEFWRGCDDLKKKYKVIREENKSNPDKLLNSEDSCFLSHKDYRTGRVTLVNKMSRK